MRIEFYNKLFELLPSQWRDLFALLETGQGRRFRLKLFEALTKELVLLPCTVQFPLNDLVALFKCFAEILVELLIHCIVTAQETVVGIFKIGEERSALGFYGNGCFHIACVGNIVVRKYFDKPGDRRKEQATYGDFLQLTEPSLRC